MNIKNKTIRVKLVGDGTKTGPLTMLNFGFTLPDQGLISKTAAGNFQLGCFEIEKENYETLKSCLAEMAKNLSNFCQTTNNQIQIGDTVYTIKFLLGGDMKFLHTMMGLNACNSNHACLWCKLHKKSFAKLSKDALPEIEDLKRTIEEQATNLNGQEVFLEDPKSYLGYSNLRIFDFITFDDCVFDTLHMLLRIVEKLMKLFLTELESLDESKSTNIRDLPYQQRFFESLRKIGVQNPIYYDNDIFKMKSFTGEDCLNILEKLHFEQFFSNEFYPKFVKKDTFNSLLRGFNEIFLNVKNNSYAENKDLLQIKTDEWLSLFTSTFNKKHVTSYIHVFCHHLCMFIEEHGDVDIYNCQGIEKRNHFLTREYFGTNRNYNQKNYQYQMMAYRNRIESYKRVVPKINRKKMSLKLNLIRSTINMNESKRNWVEYIIGEHKINCNETVTTFSTKVNLVLFLELHVSSQGKYCDLVP